jgi:hypothetical protein
MRYDLRKHHRVELNYIARVLSLGGETICDCALLDVSQGALASRCWHPRWIRTNSSWFFSASSSEALRGL